MEILFFIPERPNSIFILGEVLNPSTLRYDPNASLSSYLSLAGGLTDEADKSKIFVILPNGQASTLKNSLFNANKNNILPGSTIVVTRDSRPLDALKLTAVITPILSNLATSAAALAAISDN
ncbi:capsule biosynthesis GfcC family protein [Gammaproteobacteria bacterium]|nr:capsule biosynthesis GfcC family protein [Gammaproteobacteria bacterium]